MSKFKTGDPVIVKDYEGILPQLKSEKATIDSIKADGIYVIAWERSDYQGKIAKYTFEVKESNLELDKTVRVKNVTLEDTLAKINEKLDKK
jgi:homoserine dehydrogenase